jgi:hypothetical protein
MSQTTNILLDANADPMVRELNKANAVLDEHQKEVAKTQKEYQKLSKSGDKVRDSKKRMNSAFGQLGHQVQDFTVQMQGGQDAILAFSQQGSQMASAFGPKGAIVGAVLALGGALLGSLIPSLITSKKEMENLKDEILELNPAIDSLTASQLAFLKMQDAKEARKLTATIAEQEQKVKDLNAELKELRSKGLMSVGNESLTTAQKSDILLRRINYLSDELATNSAELSTSKQKLEAINLDNPYDNKSAGQRLKNVNDMTEALRKQVDALDQTARQQRINQLTEAGATPEQIKVDLELFDTLQLRKDIKTAEDELQSYFDGLDTLAKNNQANQKKAEEQKLKERKAFNKEIEQSEKELQSYFDNTDAFRRSQQEQLHKDILASEKALQKEIDAQTKEDLSKSKDITGIRDSLKTEQELMTDHYDVMLEQLESYNSKYFKSEEERQQLIADMTLAKNTAVEQTVLQSQMNVLSSFQSQLGQLSSMFDDATGIGKAFYLANQIMSAGMAIINGYVTGAAIKKNMALMGDIGVAGSTAESASIAMGYATAGAIMGQTLASFEGGGVTFSGVRSGGIDGKGGRMAVVHPNEKITDLEKGGSTGQPVSVQFNISAVDAKGIDQLLYERRGAITAMVQKAVNNQGRRI